MAKPLLAWRTSDQRAGALANAKASQPVRNARASSARSARFVRAPLATGAFNLDFIIVARVAQGIEQDGPNVKVGGSIPSAGTIRAAPPKKKSRPALGRPSPLVLCV